MPRTQATCIIEDCGKPAHARGLCVACYQEARRKIAAGKTTSDKLIKRGLILPRYQSPFGVSFSRK
jgi:hypothetical protein